MLDIGNKTYELRAIIFASFIWLHFNDIHLTCVCIVLLYDLTTRSKMKF